jgi:Flp pilus assembly protein TadD
MRLLPAGMLLVLALSTISAAAAGAHPLLELARDLGSARQRPVLVVDGGELRYHQHALNQAAPPADELCARSLGAGRFAQLHLEVAQAQRARGALGEAAQSYRRALACRPRGMHILGQLAYTLLELRDFEAARATVEQALDIDPRDLEINRTAGYLHFLAERWPDAVARFRYVASAQPDRESAGFAQLMLWVSQLRAGVTRPEFVERRPGAEWPQPLLLYMKGEYSEAELAHAVREGDDEYAVEGAVFQGAEGRLVEALFYVGQCHWARGNHTLAREYFAALVNLRQPHYHEHVLALAEIAKLNSRP